MNEHTKTSRKNLEEIIVNAPGPEASKRYLLGLIEDDYKDHDTAVIVSALEDIIYDIGIRKFTDEETYNRQIMRMEDNDNGTFNRVENLGFELHRVLRSMDFLKEAPLCHYEWEDYRDNFKHENFTDLDLLIIKEAIDEAVHEYFTGIDDVV